MRELTLKGVKGQQRYPCPIKHSVEGVKVNGASATFKADNTGGVVIISPEMSGVEAIVLLASELPPSPRSRAANL